MLATVYVAYWRAFGSLEIKSGRNRNKKRWRKVTRSVRVEHPTVWMSHRVWVQSEWIRLESFLGFFNEGLQFELLEEEGNLLLLDEHNRVDLIQFLLVFLRSNVFCSWFLLQWGFAQTGEIRVVERIDCVNLCL